jgi:hypothetical protein
MKTFLEYLKEKKQEYITVYHGTNAKFIKKIKEEGLKSNLGYGQGWYMMATDMESALYHSVPDDKYAYVFEFKIPYDISNHRWIGYPYLWKGEIRNDNSIWFALMQEIPSKFIKKLHKIPYSDWLERKHLKF